MARVSLLREKATTLLKSVKTQMPMARMPGSLLPSEKPEPRKHGLEERKWTADRIGFKEIHACPFIVPPSSVPLHRVTTGIRQVWLPEEADILDPLGTHRCDSVNGKVGPVRVPVRWLRDDTPHVLPAQLPYEFYVEVIHHLFLAIPFVHTIWAKVVLPCVTPRGCYQSTVTIATLTVAGSHDKRHVGPDQRREPLFVP